MNPSRHVRMFKPQFAPLVESGVKCQTVRPTPKRMPKPGDLISLRTWTGKPYRSKQRILRESVISEVKQCTVRASSVIVDGIEQPPETFATADGFASFYEMADWFFQEHGLPFDGVVIKWNNSAVK
jgi:hypothetical protein